MQIRILTAADIRSALPMDTAIDAVATAYAQLSAGKATMPLRSRFHTDKGVTLLMPAHLHESGDFAVKIVSVYGDNPSLGLPTVAATVLALDPQTGMPLALMEGDSLTALRTGAAGGVAARYLARADAGTVALFGAGVQARAQLQAAMAVRQIKRVLIVDPFETAAQPPGRRYLHLARAAGRQPGGLAAGRRGPGRYRAGRHNGNHAAF
jgi:ornithine cyclodeaminase/alanine dehydrogenase-like protein (mu-crystallin family)